jgi:membrane protein
VLRTTFSDWSEDKAPRLGAALAYYTIFSIAPLLLICVAVAGLAMGQEAAVGRLHDEMAGFVGDEGAAAMEEMIAGARRPGSGIVASVIGVVALLFGASGVFRQLKGALNTIWEVEPAPGRGWLRAIKDQFLSFAMVLCISFLLLVSLVVSTALSFVEEWMGNVIPGPDVVLHVVNLAVSFGVVSLLFALIFKYLPDVKVAWKDVWLGAMATAALFVIGKYLFGLYLGRGTIGSTYGAAGAVIVILLWAYYSSQILFLGAEFTQAHARAFGRRMEPVRGAVPVTEEARAQQRLDQ